MPTLSINPAFNNRSNALTFNTRELNMILESGVYDTFDYYQQKYGNYSWMRLNEDLKFVINWLESEPHVWQRHKSCRMDALGSVHMVSDEIEPTKMVAYSEHCYDSLFKSCFGHFFKWGGNGGIIELSEQGKQLTARVVKKVISSFIRGARLALECGSLYDWKKILADELESEVGEDLAKAFEKTMGALRGWIETQREKAKEPGYGHLNAESIMNAGHFNGSKFTGDVLELADRTYNVAPAALDKAIIEGGVGSAIEANMQPVWRASSHIYQAIARQWRKQKETPVVRDPRITMEMDTWKNSPIKTYFIDGIPVIPLHSINEYDQHLDVNTHYFGLDITGNISLGASFRNIPKMDGNEVGVRIQMSEDNKDYGMTSMRSDALMASVINRTDFMCGRILTLKKKK